MNALLNRLHDNSTLKDISILSQSKFFDKRDMITTDIPAINIALSGDLFGGLTPGLTMWCGPSKHFKTLFSLIMVKSYLQKYKDAACILYDSEFGSPFSYFDSLHINKDSVLHCPIVDIEQLKIDMMAQIEKLERGDKVILMVDSVGMLASRHETEIAMKGKDTTDMSRAKALRSLWRMITPRLILKDLCLIVVNHTYKEIGPMYPKDIVGGGTGGVLAAQNIYILGRQQEKDGDDLAGYNYIINVEKSRYVKEKSKIPVSVSFEEGINKWSGLLEIALESGHVTKPNIGWYQKKGEEKKYREADTSTDVFWLPIVNDKTFQDFVTNKFRLSDNELIGA